MGCACQDDEGSGICLLWVAPPKPHSFSNYTKITKLTDPSLKSLGWHLTSQHVLHTHAFVCEQGTSGHAWPAAAAAGWWLSWPPSQANASLGPGPRAQHACRHDGGVEQGCMSCAPAGRIGWVPIHGVGPRCVEDILRTTKLAAPLGIVKVERCSAQVARRTVPLQVSAQAQGACRTVALQAFALCWPQAAAPCVRVHVAQGVARSTGHYLPRYHPSESFLEPAEAAVIIMTASSTKSCSTAVLWVRSSMAAAFGGGSGGLLGGGLEAKS